MDLNILNAYVRKHGKPGISLVQDIQKFNINRIDLPAHPHNVHHLLLHDLQRIVGWLYFHHRFCCRVLLPLLLASHHLRDLHPGGALPQNSITILHKKRAYLHCCNEWLNNFSILEGYSFGRHYFRQFSWPSSC